MVYVLALLLAGALLGNYILWLLLKEGARERRWLTNLVSVADDRVVQAYKDASRERHYLLSRIQAPEAAKTLSIDWDEDRPGSDITYEGETEETEVAEITYEDEELERVPNR